MNKLSLITLLVAVAAASTNVLADDADPKFSYDTGMSIKTRAQVLAELQQARKDGTINASDTGYDFAARFVSMKTRAEVLAELAQARANGDTSGIHSENDSVFSWSARQPIEMTRVAKSAGR